MRAYRLLKRLMPSSGGGDDFEKAKKAIRFTRVGCANRPFYHIVVVLVSINTVSFKHFSKNICGFSKDVIAKHIQLNNLVHMIPWKITTEKS